MNKKSVIILACMALALMLAIAGAVYALYSGGGAGGSDKKIKADSAILAAIPSDAAAVMTFQDLGKSIPVLSHFCSGSFWGISRRFAALQRQHSPAPCHCQGGQFPVQGGADSRAGFADSIERAARVPACVAFGDHRKFFGKAFRSRGFHTGQQRI